MSPAKRRVLCFSGAIAWLDAPCDTSNASVVSLGAVLSHRKLDACSQETG
jgi:hypothetical protein